MAQNFRQQNYIEYRSLKTKYSYPQNYTHAPLKHDYKPGRLVRTKVRKKQNPLKVIQYFFSNLILISLLAGIGYLIFPTCYKHVVKPLFLGPNNKMITINVKDMLFPTSYYMTNDWYMGSRLLAGANTENPEMSPFFVSSEIKDLKNKLLNLMKSYPSIKPAIFVWDYDTGNYVDINGDKIYSAASIIKIPVLINMFKYIEAKSFGLFDTMTLTDYYKASGSGSMQYYQSDVKYTLDYLAKVMIQDSDNSATNMIMAKTGSMTSVNRAIKEWGLKNTYVQTWLPDLEGTNYTTAKDLTTMLYNIDNPSFLNLTSREYIVDYMSKVKNNRLIQAGLAKDALFIHKTGDIGTMLGDAGIVYMPDNKKYSIVILANRPFNSSQGVEFIKNASSIVYNYMINVK